MWNTVLSPCKGCALTLLPPNTSHYLLVLSPEPSLQTRSTLPLELQCSQHPLLACSCLSQETAWIPVTSEPPPIVWWVGWVLSANPPVAEQASPPRAWVHATNFLTLNVLQNFSPRNLSQSVGRAMHSPTTTNEPQVLFLKNVHLPNISAFQKGGKRSVLRTSRQACLEAVTSWERKQKLTLLTSCSTLFLTVQAVLQCPSYRDQLAILTNTTKSFHGNPTDPRRYKR